MPGPVYRAGAVSRRMAFMAVVLVVGCVVTLADPPLGDAATKTRQATASNLAEDTFDRADTTAGWGTTTNNDGLPNYPWAGDLATSPLAQIDSGSATIAYTGTNGHKLAGYVATPKEIGGDALLEFSFNVVGHQQCGVIIQRIGTGQWYQADLNTSLKTLQLQLVKRYAQDMNFVAGYTFPAIANTNYWIRLDVQPVGATEVLGARVWADGTPEPTTWQVTYTDTTPLPAGYPGAMGDWFKGPGPTELESFHEWAYAVTGPAVPPS